MTISRQITTFFCIVGSTLSYGLLGYNGLMQIAGKVIFGILMPSVMLPYAIGALFFGVAVEYAVYKISIREGAAFPDDLESVLKKKIAEREIEELKKLKDTSFGQFYKKKLEKLDDLLKLKCRYDKGLINPLLYNESDKQRIEKRISVLQRTLRHMKSALIQSIESDDNYPPGLSKELLEENKVITKPKLEHEISKTVSRYKLFIKIFTYGAGLTQFLITTGSLMAAFGCLPLAILIGILAGGGCLYQMRGTLTEVILANWREKIEEILPQSYIEEEDSTLKKIGKGALFFLKMAGFVVSVLGLFTLSLIALTAGSEAWVKFTTEGMQALPFVIKAGGKTLSIAANILVYGLFFLPSLVFNVLNEIEAFFGLLEELWEKINNFFTWLWKLPILDKSGNAWNYIRNNTFCSLLKDFWCVFLKNLFQFINPPALCLKIFNVVLLIGHSIANGLGTDESTRIPIETNIITNFATEVISDANFILTSEDENKEHKSKENKKRRPQHHSDKGIFFDLIEDILRVTSFTWHFFWGVFFSFNCQESLKEAREKFFPIKSLEEQDISLPNSPLHLTHKGDSSPTEKEELKDPTILHRNITPEKEDFEKNWLEFQIKKQLGNKISKLETLEASENKSSESEDKKKDSTSLISKRLDRMKELKEISEENKDIRELKESLKKYSAYDEFSHRHRTSKVLSIFFPSFKPQTKKFLESLVDTIDYLPQAQAGKKLLIQ